MFARRPGVDLATVLERFSGAAAYVEAAVGALRAAGFEIYPTGSNVDHFDIQLIGGLGEADPIASKDDLREAAARLLTAFGPARPNPAYSGGTAGSKQEDS